jgi:hypothetical protein
MAKRSHEALRARDRGRMGIPLEDTATDHAPPRRSASRADDPSFYRSLHRCCLCPDRRRTHPPSALCPALPRWMTLTLPDHGA